MARGLVFASLIGVITACAIPGHGGCQDAADAVAYTTSTESTTVVVTSVVTAHTTTTDTAFVTLTDSPCEDASDDTTLPGVPTQSPLPTAVDKGENAGLSGGSDAEQPGIVVETVFEDCDTTTEKALTTPPATIQSTSPYSSTTANAGGVAVSSFAPPPQYSAPALQPAVPWDHDTSDLSNLVPSNSSTLVFTTDGISDPTIQHLFALLTGNHTWPAVILEHSQYIRGVSCAGQGLQIDLDTPEALAVVQSSWKQNFIIITSTTLDCGSADNGQHSYWLVNSVTFSQDLLSVLANAIEIAIEDALEHVHLVWGTHVPPDQPSLLSPSGSDSDGWECDSTGDDDDDEFPDASCGPDFDDELDDELGYYDFSDDASVSEALEDFVPGLGDFDEDDYDEDNIPSIDYIDDDPDIETNSLRRRASNKKSAPAPQNIPNPNKTPIKASPAQAKPPVQAPVQNQPRPNQQSSRPSTPNQSSRPATPNQSSRPQVSNQSTRPGTPGQSSRPQGSNQSTRPGTPSSSARPQVPIQSNPASNVKSPKVAAADVPKKADPKVQSGALAKWGTSSAVSSLIDGNGNALTKFTTQAKGFFDKVNGLFKAGKKAYEFIQKAVNALSSASPEATLEINITPEAKDPDNKRDDSPWGEAYLIKEKSASTADEAAQAAYSLYCVGCSVNGTVHIAGELSFTPLQKTSLQGNLTIDGNLTASVYLGLDARASYIKESTYNIWNAAIPPGFTIPKIITLGPSISLDANLKVNISAKGTVLAGAKAEFTDTRATIDLVKMNGIQASGFTPAFAPKFEAKGEINAKARLGLPLSIGVVVQIPLLDFDQGISLANEPYVKGKASYGVPGSCPGGIAYSVGAGDKVFADIFKATTITIATYKPSTPLATGCYTPGFLIGSASPSGIAAGASSSSPTPGSPSSSSAAAAASTADDDLDNISPPNLGSVIDLARTSVNKALDTNTVVNGFGYNTIADATGTLYLASLDDGTLTMEITKSDASLTRQTWAFYNGSVATDARSRILYHFPGTMDRLGVSRVGVAAQKKVPYGSQFLTLAPVKVRDDVGILVPITSAGKIYYTVVCDVGGGTNKVFLVSDVDKGIAALQDKSSTSDVTGGTTNNCVGVVLNSSQGVAY